MGNLRALTCILGALSIHSIWADCIDPLEKIGPIEESKYRVEVCKATNRYRTSAKLSILNMDPRLSQMAQAYAQEMFSRHFFGHTNPDGRDFTSRLKLWRIPHGWAGENIAWGYRDSNAVMSGWIHSSGHRANLLNKKFRRIGVGYSGLYWVQVFSD